MNKSREIIAKKESTITRCFRIPESLFNKLTVEGANCFISGEIRKNNTTAHVIHFLEKGLSK
jgi:hypothetical protein